MRKWPRGHFAISSLRKILTGISSPVPFAILVLCISANRFLVRFVERSLDHPSPVEGADSVPAASSPPELRRLAHGSALFSNITSTVGNEGRRTRRETSSDHARLNFRVEGNAGKRAGRKDTMDTGERRVYLSASRGLNGPEGHVVSGFEIP